MSDLQCPATIVLLTQKSAGVSELRELRLARVVLAADSGDDTHARQLARVHNCDIETVGALNGRELAQRIEELADSYRGESVALVSSEQALRDALGRPAPTVPIILAVDSAGWNVLSE